MHPTMPCNHQGPLKWTCETCERTQIYPAIEWPFYEATASDARLFALGFAIERRDSIDFRPEDRTQSTP